jgi:hypothetical protein
MMKRLLAAHAETVKKKWPGLGDAPSPAGCFFPLIKASADSAAITALWGLMHASMDSTLCILAHQLWRVTLGLTSHGGQVKELGKLQNWAEQAQQEWNRDEDTLIHLDQVIFPCVFGTWHMIAEQARGHAHATFFW